MAHDARLTGVDPPRWRDHLRYEVSRAAEAYEWELIVVVSLDDPSTLVGPVSIEFLGPDGSRLDRLTPIAPGPPRLQRPPDDRIVTAGVAQTAAATARASRARGSTAQVNRYAGSSEIELRLRPRDEVSVVELAIEDLGLRSARFTLR